MGGAYRQKYYRSAFMGCVSPNLLLVGCSRLWQQLDYSPSWKEATRRGWGLDLTIRTLDSTGYASYSNMASAITYAADHGVRIVNLSLAGSSSSSTLESAVSYAWNKGTVVFASAGNYSTSTPYYPAACTNAVAVSATTASDTLSSYSNYGSWIVISTPASPSLTPLNGCGYLDLSVPSSPS